MGSRGGARELTLRWAHRVVVLAGLVGLLVVGWRYSQYVTFFGDDPCRSPGLCDERAVALARRGLSRWYLGFLALTALGLGVALARRSWRRRNLPDHYGGFGAVRHTGLAGLVTVAWLGWLVATFFVWLFGGAPLVIAVAVTWLVGLTWALDRLHRRGVPGEATGATLLVSGGATLTAVVGALAGMASAIALGGRWGLLLPALGVLVGVVVVTAVARVPGAGGVALAVSGSLVAALVGAVLVGMTQGGRDSLDFLRDEFSPEIPPAAQAPALPLSEEGPRPPGVPSPNPAPNPSPTTLPTVAPVRAARACGPSDLTLRAAGWDSAMGDSSVTIVATNRSASACWVEGYPKVRLLQGGTDLALEVGNPSISDYGLPLKAQRVGVAPGGEARFGWWWKGYRTAADQETPQTVVVDLARGAGRIELPGDPYLVDVIEGAKVDVTPWGPRQDR